ncbi:hypothetical protein NL108_016252 [Boleophthalmus pectinirostris]|nr:hypothetical protein NL108_016252 [Boleophthalmus pectinirostris]
MVIIRDAIKSILKYLSKNNAADPDRRWSVHYSTHKPLHGLIFLPSTTRGSQSSSPEPSLTPESLNEQNGSAPFASSPRIHQSERSRGFEWRRRSRKTSSFDSDDDERLVVGGARPMTPLVLTSCWEGPAASCEEGGTSCGLPTPEEVTRRRAQSVMADIVPIDITGETLERQASRLRSQLHTRPSLTWTRPGLNQDYSQDQDLDQDYRQDPGPDLLQSSVPGPSRIPDQDQDRDQRSRTEPRRIRAPRGDLSSLMHTLTSSTRLRPQEDGAAYNSPAYNSPAYNSPAYKSPAYNSPAYNSPAYNSPAYKQPRLQKPRLQGHLLLTCRRPGRR